MGLYEDSFVCSERHYKAGYVIRELFVDDRDWGGNGLFMKTAFTPTGDWIGDSRQAHFFCKKKGIAPKKAKKSHCVCSIGFSEKDGKFYGWSHRAIVGFAIGDRIFEMRFGNDNTPFRKHGHKTIKTRADQRKAAKAFANYVS